MAEQYDLHPIQISEWKNQLAESAGLVFSKGKQPSGSGEEEIKALPERDLTLMRTIDEAIFSARSMDLGAFVIGYRI